VTVVNLQNFGNITCNLAVHLTGFCKCLAEYFVYHLVTLLGVAYRRDEWTVVFCDSDPIQNFKL